LGRYRFTFLFLIFLLISEVAVTKSTQRVFGQFSRFLAVGSLNALVDFLVYLSLTRGFMVWQRHYLWANAVAFLLANFNSFMWNRWWTFRARHGHPLRQYLEFLGVSIIYLGFIQAGLWLLVSQGGVFDLIAKVIVIGFGMALYFLVLRRVVFARQPPSAGEV